MECKNDTATNKVSLVSQGTLEDLESEYKSMELDFEEVTSKMEQIVEEIKTYQDMNDATNRVSTTGITPGNRRESHNIQGSSSIPGKIQEKLRRFLAFNQRAKTSLAGPQRHPGAL